MYALNPIDYDNVTAYIDAVVPDGALDGIHDVVDLSPRDGEPYRKVPLSRDLTVMSYPVRTKVSGSPHKHVHGESVGVFGPAEMRAFVEDLAGRLRLPLQAVLNGRVSRLDVSVNLHVDHDVDELLRLVSAPPQMEELLFRTGTKTFKNSVREITLYDKVGKLLDKGKGHLVPDDWVPGRVLRVEVRFDHMGKEFGRTVTVGDLCTPAFYEEASARWLKWVLGVRVQEGVWTVPRGGRTVREIRDNYAADAIVLTGGRIGARRRIDAARRAGALTSGQASRQRKWVDDVSTAGGTSTEVNVEIEDCDATIEETIAGKFKGAVTAAASPRRR